MTDHGLLLEFQDLIFTGAASRIKEIGAAFEGKLSAGRTRDKIREQEAQRMGGDDGWLAFNRAALSGIPAEWAAQAWPVPQAASRHALEET